MRKRILPLLIAIGLVMSVSRPIFAETLTQKLDNQKKQLHQQQASYNIIQKNSEKLSISIEMLDSDIENMYYSIDNAKKEIISTQKKIDQTTKDIVVAQNKIKGEESLFNERMRAMYMNGADSYVEILLNSKGVEDLISRVENVKSIVEYDNKIIKELNEKKKDIEDRKKLLNDSKTKVLALKTDNESKLDKLSAKKNEQHILIVEANKQQELHKNEIAQTQALLGSTTNEINNEAEQDKKEAEQEKVAAEQNSKNDLAIATNRTQQVTASRGNLSNNVKSEAPAKSEPQVSQPKASSSASSNELIAYAKTFLGTPYQWAANGPNTFDCSGFTKYVFAHFGVSMGRTTYVQITQGQYVSRQNLQPGDLVFFGTGTPHHVGIYVGNNAYIHAPKTGDVVKISQLTRSDYMSARRFR
ncbi:C40 family peptidase [Clostridium lacusfryxellense]|uniref:C40 family peptidase n=1 Tax=Clostridium lacusfryxellense TaxID=205328 RepID=UPI001C0D2BE9|nr:C40 family peptidase [Clostridium lacusfryxellense]MBU3113960.1 C40 family peptidase [Clostridium lacusfryxellense]